MTTATVERVIEVPLIKNSNVLERIPIPDNFDVSHEDKELNKWQRRFRFISPKDGDKRVVWDCRDMSQIEEAKAMFDECVAKGFVPYRVGRDGKKTSEVMDEFDPDAEEVIFVPMPQVVGG